MLSKIRYFTNNTHSALAESKNGIDVIQAVRFVGGDEKQIKRVNSGTLGASFIVNSNSGSRFFKTHADPAGMDSIKKEYTILNELYGDEIQLECFSVKEADCDRLWLVMTMLVDPEEEVNPIGVSSIITWYLDKLQAMPQRNQVAKNYTISMLIDSGWKALSNMSKRRTLTKELIRSIDLKLSSLFEKIPQFPVCLCHGDLGPKNIMSNMVKPIIIDWEDAFWGIEGYDYLYWLTFMNNRKYYSQNILGRTPLGKDLEIAVLALVVLLKSELSYQRRDSILHKLTVDQRLTEVLSLR